LSGRQLHNGSFIRHDTGRGRLPIRRFAVWRLVEMKERRLKNVPITDLESRPVGVLNARDALEILLQEVEDEESLLRDYVMCVGYH
jgi:hypothetical protein